jgi:hypothetical protein
MTAVIIILVALTCLVVLDASTTKHGE